MPDAMSSASRHAAVATGIYGGATRYDTYFTTAAITTAGLIHEALHSHFRIDDEALADKLDLGEAYRNGDSGVITTALQNAGCHD